MLCLAIFSVALLYQASFVAAFTAHPLQRTHRLEMHNAASGTTRHRSISFGPANKNIYSLSMDPSFCDENGRGSFSDCGSRRDVIHRIAGGISSALLVTSTTCIQPSTASAASALPSYGSPDRPVLIVGGNGRTGMQVAETLASGTFGKPMTVVVTTRTGKDPFAKIKLPSDIKNRIVPYDSSVDVRNLDSIMAAVKNTKAGAVVYAASASKAGGNAAQVDGDGPANAARAARAQRAKLVLISALALDRPDSKSYQITNTMGGFIDKIMDEKLRGEDAVRDIMGGRGKGDYVIIRPGPLLSGKSKNGANDIELNQDDTVGGGLSRDELAGVVIGALQAGIAGVTVECYRSKTATALQPDFSLPSGNELRASSYVELFDGAKIDA